MPALSRPLMIVSLLSSVLVSACASEYDDADEEWEESEAEITGTRSVSLKYEGTCDFLRSCSVWSRGLPEGNVLWGCSAENTSRGDDGSRYGACSDEGLWVAGPTKAYCGKSVRICKGSTCINAKVKDISVSRSWEASNGVLSALRLPYGLTSRCGGYGGGKVTVTY